MPGHPIKGLLPRMLMLEAHGEVDCRPEVPQFNSVARGPGSGSVVMQPGVVQFGADRLRLRGRGILILVPV